MGCHAKLLRPVGELRVVERNIPGRRNGFIWKISRV